MTTYIPAGQTYRIDATTVSSYVTVASDTPVRAWSFMNDGGQPVQIKFFVSNTGTVAFSGPGSPGYDFVLQKSVENQVVGLPARLATSCAGLGGFTSTVNISVIAESGTVGVSITPVL